jgi:epoxyqueuosine reductase
MRGDYQRLKDLALSSGASLFGVADITELRRNFHLPSKKLFPLAISLAYRLSDPIIEELKDRPTLLYYHHYKQANYFLDRLALMLSSHIQDEEWRAIPIPASQTIDWDRQLGHLSHKKVAQRAGLGWIGRNNLLVTPQFGARVRLVTILTDMPLPPDSPSDEGCGSCRDCLPVCPVGAIKERQEDFEHIKCFEKLRQFRKLGYVGHHICGLCVKACKGPKGPFENF